MIAHVVLFQPRGDLSSAQRRSMIDAIAAAAADIPSVRRFRVGARVMHGRPGYEQAMREPYDYAAIAEFDDLAGLEAYLVHPLHAAIARHFATAASAALAYDYEIVDATDRDAMSTF